jgi:altered-inheritance-of-mitochondria protein 5
MGFTTGLLGGATLTYSILYLTLYVHKANRSAQHTLLSQSHMLLNSAVEPLPPLPEPPAYEVRKTSLTEELKDKWNGEIENAVRRLQTTDWDELRSQWERKIGNVFERAGESDAGKEVAAAGDRLKDTVVAAADGAKEAAKGAAKNIKDNVIGAKEETKDTVKAAKTKTIGKRLLEI